MGPNQAPLFPIRILKITIWFTVFFYLFFLIFNTSFTIMGVDVGDFLKQYLGAFFGVYLSTTFKVFSVSLFLHLTLFSLVYLTYHFLKRPNVPWYELSGWVVLIECLALLHSMVSFPQIYGEFFFFRYPSFAPFLYFLTDHTKPGYFSLVLGILILGFASVLFRQIYLYKTKESLFALLHVLALGLLHASGYYMVGIFYFAILFWQGKHYQKIHVQSYGFAILLFLFLYLIPSIWTRIEAFTRTESKGKPPIFIIAADSLRYDRIGFKLNGKSITPNIDLFSNDSIVFHDHHTTIPRTFPSWADLLTGQYSMSHKVRDMFPSPEEKQRIGSRAFSTIQQKLKEIGYRSYAIGSFAADIFPRANFGFDEVLAPNFNARIMTVQRTAESQLFLMPFLTGSWFSGRKYLEEMDGLSTWGDGSRILDRFRSVLNREGQDSFSVTYFSSVIHFPYTPAYPYYKTFTDPNYYGKYKYLKFVDPTNSTTPDEEEIKQIRGLFDSAVFAFDSEFGDIISDLKDKGIYDEAIIILTADHGEALYEDVHGQGHGEHLRGEAVTHVPLLIKFPKSTNSIKPNQQFTGITSSIDIYPTLMDYLNIATKQKFPGRSLLPTIGKSNWEDDRLVYAETGIWFSDAGDHFFQKQRIPYPNILSLHQVVPEQDYQIMITDPIYRETIAFSKHRSVQNSNYKLIYIPTRQGVIFELYDRKKDPLNTKNLYPNHPMAVKMKDMLYQTVIQWEDASLAGEYLIPSSLSDINEN
ncbi:sulfatase family protein [Leptospira harrisiae]|uniref:Sulfatase n=1 Tax=Leptospira harrisiae TaxID=2023189 RepID=A0A2N0AQL2_9LEPT|nr:sulfatase-like hydrolase/transferase [Leptospira harrisiae]PJZ86550.1 sulfatase [Leptospira harrisiae]PKA10110.1 sulfatase [Leptospira harrisiae]